MKLQKLLSYTRRAVDDYDMIHEGDKIAIGISGGKDSLALLYALHGLQRFYPNKFDLHAISVKLGMEPFDLKHVSELCETLNIPFTVIDTQIGPIVFEERQENNPCSLCAKMRKGALNDAALSFGCNKVALGHNKDDIIETVMMSMFFEARYYCFPPVTYLTRMQLYSIRPLLYVPELEIRRFAKLYELPIVKSPCPVDGNTKREHIKKLIKEQSKIFPGLPARLFKGLQTSEVPGWKLNTEASTTSN